MRYRLLGNSGLRVSEAALGTMTLSSLGDLNAHLRILCASGFGEGSCARLQSMSEPRPHFNRGHNRTIVDTVSV